MITPYKKYVSGILLATTLFMTGCKDQSFVDFNTDPEALTEVPPANQLLNAIIGVHDRDFEAFYDNYQRIMPWMQYSTGLNGNGQNFTQVYDNFANRYGALYTTVGNAVTDIEKQIEKMPAEEQARYVHLIRMGRVIKAYYAFYVSDIYGSIPYSEAIQGRYGGTLTPKYDTQQTLFNTLDEELKEAISVLKTTPSSPQITLGNLDQYYGGDAKKWVKAANALRLKIAMRMAKVDAAKMRTIVQEVLASPVEDLMSSNADGWVFVAAASFTSGGNWNPAGLRASKPVVDFMWDTQDPRLDAFFTKNNYSQANIDLLIASNPSQLPAGTKEPARRYVGSFTSPDAAQTQQNVQRFYTPRFVTVNGNRTAVDTLSYIQPRLFQASYSVNGTVGTGRNYFPVITYADFCFMRAELAAQTITAENAKTWYESGVMASLEWYDVLAQNALVTDYTAMTTAEKAAYLAHPKVAFSSAKAMDLIASQEYIHFLRQPSEGWATWKRTGFPNANSTLALPALISNGATLTVPRRAPLGLPAPTEPNYTNRKAAYDEMAKLPGFGTDPQDATGRVWWDRP
ncbi:SusD/RagB family nutrient-binding outer membrane lipoprotein [Siphonobacter curvatus]|uniref:SusD/RagB family nutrient-binding outer membrane lipoprotein n=1 Tax=Siphonobacter curvatus TaxID=2094562 RepID=A0A2S7II17_9BACT|nr:SusD/RagB family nutrient-binding outer membrane lipoprotein [Siphonobacter curvatus]PQA55585.1 SusD/RagB family nutrient-binding outer membrane lipoprotein [Siphonobacter curvatus]